MSAIFGVHRWDGGTVESDSLAVMGSRLQQRGNGSPKTWSKPIIGLGNCLSAKSLDSPLGTLPYWWAEAELGIVADVRLDNRKILIEMLGAGRKTPDTIPDGELILRAYQKWGEACPEKLLGDFAFAIWDERRQTLFCARDPFGVRPFYLHLAAGSLSFASDFAALLALRETPAEINRSRIAHFLTWMDSDDDQTFYQSIQRLRPAHALSARCGEVKIVRYYQIPLGAEKIFRDDAECEEAFREVFAKAIRRRMAAGGPTACMLSGGLDSSAIACMASHLHKKEQGDGLIHTFSNTYQDSPECDEGEFIQSVLAQGGYEAHMHPVQTAHSVDDLEALMRVVGEPTHALGLFGNHGSVYRSVQAAGFDAVLDGHGGDEVLSEANAIIRQLADQNRWLELALEYRPWLQAYDMPFLRNYVSLVLSHGLPARLRRRFQLRTRLRGLGGQPNAALRNVSPKWAAPLNPQVVSDLDLVTQRRVWRSTQPDKFNEARAAHLHVLTHTGQSIAFEQLGRIAADCGVEPRYPFWDRELVEFCLALPARQKLRRGWNRTVMRKSLGGILPDRIRWRRGKTDFSAQIAASLKSLGEDRMRALFETQTPGVEILSGSWHQNAITRLFHGDEGLGTDLSQLWSGISLLVWSNQQEAMKEN